MNKQPVDQAMIEEGVRLILKGIGEDTGREGLLETPLRVSRMYKEIFDNRDFNATQFSNVEQYSDIVMVRDIPFYSMCEHHMLPFFGSATVSYIPQASYLGLSKLARAVDYYSRQLQVQERLTTEVAQWLWDQTQPAGVAIMIRARHMCMEMRGVRKIGSETLTTAFLGKFKTDSELETKFFRLAKL